MNYAYEFCTFYDIPDLILNINGHQKWNICCSMCLYNSVLIKPCVLLPSDQNCADFRGRWHVKLEQGQLNVVCSGVLLLLVLGCILFPLHFGKTVLLLKQGLKPSLWFRPRSKSSPFYDSCS